MFEIDPRFRQDRQAARSRQRKRRGLRFLLFGVLPFGVLAFLLLQFTALPAFLRQTYAGLRGADDGAQLVQLDEAADIAPPLRKEVFLNIAGDPAILHFDESDRSADIAQAEGSGVFDVSRFGLPRYNRFTVIRDDLVKGEERLMIQLPSSREDFAMFVASRDQAEAEASARASSIDAGLQAELEALQDSPEISEEAGEDFGEAAPPASEAGTAAPVANHSSVSIVRRDAERTRLYRDLAIRITLPRPLRDVLEDNGLSAAAADRAASAVSPILAAPENLPSGAVVGLRLLPDGAGGESLGQISLYLDDRLAASAAMGAQDMASAAADPWFERDLPALAKGEGTDLAADVNGGQAAGSYRLLDAIYSAAVRDGVPTALAGELITLLSQSVDLDRTATAGDRVTLAYAPQHGLGGSAAGQWLYAGVDGPSWKLDCYVLPEKGSGFRCATSQGTVTEPAGSGVLQSPVAGVMTSRYGMRKHPVLGVTRLHAGLDWAAPVGTVVRAAAAGKVASVGVSGGYGNLVVLSHTDGLQTRYAHLQGFAAGLKAGDIVQAGQELGKVGLTGITTGAHLHFELRLNGEPTDPMPYLSGAVLAGSSAVEALVAQIIRVESGNNASAQNPNSTARGLGQFVEQTWLRMMARHRPELAASLGRAELLALRDDPDLSREMVRQLARDNEAHLVAAGHQVTPGRLYLAHFLGAEGADRALRAGDAQTVLEVMGARVVAANSFLTNYTISDLKAWADRKMGNLSGGVAAPVVVPPPPEVAAFISLVDDLLARSEG